MIDPDERFNVFLPIFYTLFRKPFHRPDCRLDPRVRMRPPRLALFAALILFCTTSVLPASVFSGKVFQVRRSTSMAALASTRGRTRVSIHSGSSVGCSVIAATKAVMNPSCTSMTPGPGACGRPTWSVIWRLRDGHYRLVRIGWRYDRNWHGFIGPGGAWKARRLASPDCRGTAVDRGLLRRTLFSHSFQL